ncbi:MAG: DEAD/DEAH box helicase [Magnetospirillum sp.]|nr:DEAD/DEAH box helicase [Magnetospirillum sp.]
MVAEILVSTDGDTSSGYPRTRAGAHTYGDIPAKCHHLSEPAEILTPRPYQTAAIADLRASMRDHRRVLLVLPTGAGKTFIAATVAAGAHAKARRVVFIVHRDELVRQTSATFTRHGIPHAVVAAGHPTPSDRVVVASVQTLARRLDAMPAPDLLFVDEAHHAVAGTWRRILAAWPSAFVVGLTATPERLDGRGLGDVFGHLIAGPTTADLIAGGYLSDYRAFAPSTADLAGVQTRMGDFDHSAVAEAMDRPALTGDIVAHYQRIAPDARAIAFAASVAHSEHLAEAIRAAGIAAAHVDGETPRDQRRAIIADFAAGHIRVLCNVDLFGEGFDVPAVEAVILARPTQSLALHLQQVGRALRTAPGKDHAIILDHAGNLSRHGLPDEPRNWSLTAPKRTRKPSESGPAVRQCPTCYAVHRPTAACPECGHQYAPMVRELEHRDGQLVELRRGDWTGGIDLAGARGRDWFALLEAAGGDIKRLRQIARARGFRRGWATHRMNEWNRKRKQEIAA